MQILIKTGTNTDRTLDIIIGYKRVGGQGCRDPKLLKNNYNNASILMG